MASVNLRFGKKGGKRDRWGLLSESSLTLLYFIFVRNKLFCLVKVMLQILLGLGQINKKQRDKQKCSKVFTLILWVPDFLRTHCIINDYEHESCSNVTEEARSCIIRSRPREIWMLPEEKHYNSLQGNQRREPDHELQHRSWCSSPSKPLQLYWCQFPTPLWRRELI